MRTQNHVQVKAYINKVIAYAKKQQPGEKLDAFCEFIKLLFTYTSAVDLKNRSVSDLYGLAISFWDLMLQRKKHELKIRIVNPNQQKEGWQSKYTVIQVITDDMPFLVDSIRMELNRLGLTTHLMIHTGGIKVARDEKGKIKNVFPYETSNTSNAEAPIYIEIDKQTDKKLFEKIKENLARVLTNVRNAVRDWSAMQARVRESIKELEINQAHLSKGEIEESVAFLKWLLDDNFTFLGTRDYEVHGKNDEAVLHLISGSGLGVLSDDSRSRVDRAISELPEQARELLLSKEPISISKTNTIADVHRPVYSDYISVKRFNAKGELIGERRFIGLFTSTAYNTNPDYVPLLRRKTAEILMRSKLPEKSHAGKDLKNILTTLPRDDLFQATVDELYELSMGILYLQERRGIRLFVRKDAYNRFVSCLVFVPRENFNTDLINSMENILQDAFNGTEVALTIHFSESILARIHFVIRLDPQKELLYDVPSIEQKLSEVGKSWQDGLRECIHDYFGEERSSALIHRYLNAFPAGYRDIFSPRNAVLDIENIEKILVTHSLGMSFYRPVGAARDVFKFKLYRLDFTVPLSDALPMLENMGLRVIDEQPYAITLEDGRQVWINDFSMLYVKEPNFEIEDVKEIFQEAFNKVWLGEAENDAFNKLVLEAQLTWREITILRGYTKYLRQTGFTFSQHYIAETLVANASIAKLLINLFRQYFDPYNRSDHKAEKVLPIEFTIEKKLETVAILDEDRILRRFLDVIHATLRTNYYQVDEHNQPKCFLSFKFNPKKIPELPLPLPKYEIFVYSPRFEAVHLRAGKVARGGLRWSDRREDFRTEILGLMKAQQVKNALIVPTGAKGGFVTKMIRPNATREEILEEGIFCYQDFIRALLDLTDNLVEGKIISPANTVCYDDHDTYLVVAADKGTATFSDIANQISLEKGFWLGDAFASGGSSGYDHKKMGITARGAWLSAERHFQELGINVNDAEIKVVGIGDMSGDVFGNGMLISKNIKLVAAFNHEHIFLDPNPNPEKSYEERKRLFNLPRSTWNDYNRDAISPGGGVYQRSMKSITISPEVKALLDLNQDVLIPSELVRAILKAPVEMIWNGGIGTFVKATSESNQEVGDRTNDGIRINGNELKTRVVCEGGNLGFTQLGRIEYALNGGKINTDFIDNSAGVDCSDHEVNIKIFLNHQMAMGDMTLKQRNQLLIRMTQEVSDLVLQDNYYQNLALSLASTHGSWHLDLYMRYLNSMEDQKKINRVLEFLPTNKTLMERKALGLGFTRPELAIMLSYSKINLDAKIRKSGLTKDPYLSQYIKNAFPTPMRKRYGDTLVKHRLHNEIISTQITNQLVSEMGMVYIYRMQDETGATIPEIVKAYSVAREIFHLADLYADIESLDYRVETTRQYDMFHQAIRLIRRSTRWLLNNAVEDINIIDMIQKFSSAVASLSKHLPKILLGAEQKHFEKSREELIEANVPAEIAVKVAKLPPLYHSLNIIAAAAQSNMDPYFVGCIYFMLVERLDLYWFSLKIDELPADNRWMALAKSGFKADLDHILSKLTLSVIHVTSKKQNINAQIEQWFEKNNTLIHRWNHLLADLRRSEKVDFTLLSVALRELESMTQKANNFEKPSGDDNKLIVLEKRVKQVGE